jgi:hypothetical protein
MYGELRKGFRAVSRLTDILPRGRRVSVHKSSKRLSSGRIAGVIVAVVVVIVILLILYVYVRHWKRPLRTGNLKSVLARILRILAKIEYLWKDSS